MADITIDLLIERLESYQLEIRKTNKVNNTPYHQNFDLYYRVRMILKTVSPKTAFSAENSNTVNEERPNNNPTPSSGYHGSTSAPSQQQQYIPKNVFQCNIEVNMNNA
ncbi:hypothetical protein Hanom_Chr01g00049261 [Helianthus anomalus]